MALIGRFFGRTASEGAAYAFGVATGPVLAPATETVRQDAWKVYPHRTVPVGVAAAIVAEDVASLDWGREEATRQGIGNDRFDAMVSEAREAPGLSTLLELWRRGIIDGDGFNHGLAKAKLEPRWTAWLRELHDVLLSPDTLANARQQGFVDERRQHSESALQGVTSDRADILYELSGNPPGPETLQRALNRGVIDQGTFDQAIREGRTKTKYTDFYRQMARPILSAATYVRAYLKGHITQAEMHAGGAKWGYTPTDLDLWYQSEGRPATVHQIHIGYARGARLPGARNEKDAIDKSVAQSDIRPEYADLLYASRYSYPSAFVLRGLVQSGAITEKEGEDALLFSGWEPTFAKKVATSWAGSSGAPSADPHIAKAQTQLWTQTHASYLNRESSQTVARTKLAQAGVAATAITQILGIWDHERELIRKGLTPANVKKAFAKGSRNNATGQPWTRDEALAFLVGLGWSANEANDYLDIP